MAWIFLAESGESPLLWHHGSDRLPTVKTIPTPNPSLSPECKPEICQSPPFGMMCEHCKRITCPAPQTLSMGDSPARILALRVAVKAWKESEAGYFSRSCAWPKKSSPRSYSLKMSPPYEREDLLPLLEHFPASGMTADGELFPLMMWERRIGAKDGFYWQTPKALMIEESYENYLARMRRSKDKKSNTKTRPGSLAIQVKTPQFWPTPTREDYRRRGPNSKQQGLPEKIYNLDRGQLSPMWVEWLMGYRIEWTELNALGMQWFRSKQGKRLKD